MAVGLARRILRAVAVAVVLVVTVSMGVHRAAMGMRVRVPLGEVPAPWFASASAASPLRRIAARRCVRNGRIDPVQLAPAQRDYTKRNPWDEPGAS